MCGAMRFMREASRSEINVVVQEKLFRFFHLRDKKWSITEPQAFYFGSLCFIAIKRSHFRHPEPTPLPGLAKDLRMARNSFHTPIFDIEPNLRPKNSFAGGRKGKGGIRKTRKSVFGSFRVLVCVFVMRQARCLSGNQKFP